MIKLNVTHRVFLAILAANVIIVLSMFLVMQWNMDRGFLRYVNQLEQNRMERLAAKLGKAYGVSGGWEFILKSPETLSRLIGETISESYTIQPSPVTVESGQEQPNQIEARPVRRFYRWERRLLVLDATRSPVFGTSDPAAIGMLKPISDKGKVVGYIGMLPSKFLSEKHQLKFGQCIVLSVNL